MLNANNLKVGMTIEIDDCYNASQDGSNRIEGEIVGIFKHDIALRINVIGIVYIAFKNLESLNPQFISIQKD